MYKYLLFDLDDTLLDFKTAQDCAMARTLQNYKIEPTRENLQKYAQINRLCWSRFEKGEITRPEIFTNRTKMFGEFLGVNLQHEPFTKTYLSHLANQGQTLPYATELLKILQQKGYKMAAATNGTLNSQTGRIIFSGLMGFFKKGIFISELIGFQKPDPNFFLEVLNRMGVQEKNEVLMVGDSLVCDVEGASAAGIDSCLVDLSRTYTKENCPANYIINSLEELISTCNL